MIKKMICKIALIIFLLGCSSLYSQDEINKIVVPDSLLGKSYDELKFWYYQDLEIEGNGNPLVYAKAYLQKAKKENNKIKAAKGYHYISYANEEGLSIVYLDSIIYVSKDLGDTEYPASAYFSIGAAYYNKRKYKIALDNYLKANEYARKNYNPDIFLEANFGIGVIKNQIGNYEEVIEIQRNGLNYLKNNNLIEKKNHMYLNSLFSMAISFYPIKKLDSALFYSKLGIKKSLKSQDFDMYNRFVMSSGISYYFKGYHKKALDSLNKSLVYFSEVNHKPIISLLYFYLGKIYYETDDEEKGIYFLKKMDSIFQLQNDIHYECRQGYEILINHYKKSNNKKSLLIYIEKFLKADSILNSNYRYLQKNITKNYDTPLLINEKELVIKSLENKNKKSSILSITFSILSFVFLVFLIINYRKRIAYKKRFEKLLETKPIVEETKYSITPTDIKAIGIADDIIKNVLEELKEFEQDNGFLEPNITIVNLAKKFNTNSKYLSKIVNVYKEKSFILYINELRIDYAVNALKDDKKYRKYTIKGMTEEFGFNTSEVFSKSFYKKTGIYPSYFIREMEKKELKGVKLN